MRAQKDKEFQIVVLGDKKVVNCVAVGNGACRDGGGVEKPVQGQLGEGKGGLFDHAVGHLLAMI